MLQVMWTRPKPLKMLRQSDRQHRLWGKKK
jgi:hypothetical protein